MWGRRVRAIRVRALRVSIRVCEVVEWVVGEGMGVGGVLSVVWLLDVGDGCVAGVVGVGAMITAVCVLLLCWLSLLLRETPLLLLL